MKATIVGLAREGSALARYLSAHGVDVTITDEKPAADLGEAIGRLEGLPVNYALGGHSADVLDGADAIYLSAGVRRDTLPFAGRSNLSSETALFFEKCPAPIYGVTGSAGKTTTATLLGQMLQATGKRVFVGGNMGRPLIDLVDDIAPTDLVVLELSSFQLEFLQRSPQVAVVTNITPNHLDRHPTVDAYVNAKANIVTHQSSGDVAILNANDAGSSGLGARAGGRVLRFNGKDAFLQAGRLMLRGHDSEYEICRWPELRLLGRHNVDNVLAASLAAFVAGVAPHSIREAAIGFGGVRHRLQLVREVDGAAYYNDSIATSPDRTLAGLAVFDRPVVLIAGGVGKGISYEPMAEAIKARVKAVVLMGDPEQNLGAGKGEPVVRVLEPALAGAGLPLAHAGSLAAAVHEAQRLAAPGDVVLLSPGGTSFDMFVDYEDRGDQFVRLVEAL